MTYYREVWILCDGDGCMADYEGGRTATETRELARKDGWTYTNGEDYCPKHNSKPTPAGTTDTGRGGGSGE